MVTGAAGCLGRIIGRTLEQQGCRVVAWDVDREAVAALRQEYPEWQATACDLTRPDEVAAALDAALAACGHIDGLVNNAGLIHNQLLFNFMGKGERRHGLAQWQRVLDANLTSCFVASAHVAEHMATQRVPGVIVNVGSIAAQGNAGQSAYAAAKAGIAALTVTWAKELGPLGIRVAAIAPGFADTRSTHQALSDAVLQDWIKKTALRRLVNPQSIADAVVHILTNDDLTGAVIPIDAGMRL